MRAPPEESRKALIFLFKPSIYKGLCDLIFSILGNKNVQIKLAYLQLFLGIIRLCERYVRYQVNLKEWAMSFMLELVIL